MIKANHLPSLIYKLYFEIFFIENNSFYTSFKIKREYTFQDLESIIYIIRSILKQPENRLNICQQMGKYYKNKFINFLPEEFITELKFQILFNEEGLIDLCENKQPIRIGKSKIKQWDKKIVTDEEEKEFFRKY